MSAPPLPRKYGGARTYASPEARKAHRLEKLEIKIRQYRAKIAEYEDKIRIVEMRAANVINPPKRGPLSAEQKARMRQGRLQTKGMSESARRLRRESKREESAALRKLTNYHVGERRLTKADTARLRANGVRGFRAGKYVSEQTFVNLGL